jgi:Phytanoyl-CoA dioxygenase (PhyH)
VRRSGAAANNDGMDTEAFIRDGYVALRGAVDPDTTAACRELVWAALAARGVRAADRGSWPVLTEIDDLDDEPFRAAGIAPALLAGYDALIGPGRYTLPVDVGRALVIRFPAAEHRANAGYHIEGSFTGPDQAGGYWVNVRSRARGLLALFLLSDVTTADAPTRLIQGSHRYVPEFLAPYGEAGTSSDAEFWRPSVLCRPVVHATGHAGDVFLCHPFIVHTATWPHTGAGPRMLAQPEVHARDGFRLDGSDPSPVARAIVAGLELARSD